MFNYTNIQSDQSFDHTLQFPNYGKQALLHSRFAEAPRSFAQQNLTVLQAPVTHQPIVPAAKSHEDGKNLQNKSVQRSSDKNKIKGVVDTSNFSVEERLVASVWVHERARSRSSIGQIKREFRQRFNKDAPTKNTLLIWEKKLFSTGNVMDAQRSGRPCQRKEHIDMVQASVTASPGLSLRARAVALSLPRTTLRKILCDDLNVDKQAKKKAKARKELSGVVKRKNGARSPITNKKKPKHTKAKVQSSQNTPHLPEHQHGSTVPVHHTQPQNHINYRGYPDIVLPVHQFQPYVSYQNPGDIKQHMHHTNMATVSHIPHQQYVVGPMQGHVQ